MTTEIKSQELAQAQEALLWLAGREMECPRVHVVRNGVLSCGGDKPCSLCQGTGTVARFPQLRGECSDSHFRWDWCDGEWGHSKRCTGCDCVRYARHKKHYGGAEHCPQCQGRGWLPVSVRDGAAELRKLPEFFEMSRHPGNTFQVIMETTEGVFTATAHDDEVAVILAAAKWQQEANHD